MTTSDIRSGRVLLTVVAATAVLISACGGVERDVAVPAAATADNQPPFRSADVFTETAAVAPLAVAETVVPEVSETMPSTTAERVTVPAEQSSTSVSVDDAARSPVEVAAPLVVPVVSGWAAFDLHLMTVLSAGSPAVSATVLRDGRVVHEVALGERTQAGEPTAIGDRYRVASISKVITTIAVLRLVEQGTIALDDPVGARLAARVGVPAPAAGVEQITLRRLLTHRSGIAQYENLMFRRQVESCEQAASVGLSRELERTPGTTFRYSNLNFCLTGLLIEDVTGRSYEEVVRTELLVPLGIEGMRLAGTFDVREGDVEHRSDEGRNYMEVLGAAGSWIASPTDVATIVDSLDVATPGWKPLAPQTVAEMRTITRDPPLPPEVAATTIEPPTPPTRGYGMGLMIFGEESFGHTGTVESTHAMTVRQSDGITWAVTVSGDHPSSSRDLAGIVSEALRYAGVT